MSTADSIWELISSGDLFPAKKIAELRDDFDRSPPTEAADPLDWLLGREAITEYHAKVFRAGHAGPFRYGDYVVNDRITEGYFKGGFRAEHAATGHPVVLSFVTEDKAAEHWPRLKAMTHATQFFNSPFLVRCFEADENEDFKFLVFEDFDSVSLSSILARKGQLKPKTACDVIRRVALALQTMHQSGYSHGHVSSQHVRVQGGTVVKLFFDPDYYFIPPVKADQHPDPLSLVQVDYLAPELGIPGNRPDELTDIYALGCLFYEILTGKPPFPLGSVRERMQQHATQRVKPLENLGYDKNLSQFIYFLLAKNRRLRFQTIADVVQQLNALPDSGNPKPRSPEPPPTLAKFDKYIRAKLADENLHTQVPPTNLLSASPSTANESASIDVAPAPTVVAEPISTQEPAAVEPSASQAAESPVAVPGKEQSPASAPPVPDFAPVQLRVSPEEAATTSSFRQRQKASLKKTLLPVGITLLVLAVPLLMVYWMYGDQLFSTASREAGNNGDPAAEQQGKDTPGESVTGDDPVAATLVNLVDDDQRTLWESPTAGPPLELTLTPPGMRLLLSVRGAELFAQDTESLLSRSLGPEFHQQVQVFEQAAGISWKETSRLNFSVHDNNVEGQDGLLTAMMVEPVDPKDLVYWLAKWGDCTKQESGTATYYNSSNGWSYFVPQTEPVDRFLIGPESLVKVVAEQGAGLPPLGVPQLLAQTDRERQLNLVVVPMDLTSPSGVTLFSPNWLKVTRLMNWYLGGADKIQAAFLSLHFDGGDVYLETGMKPQLDKDPYTLAEELRQRLAAAPDMVMNYMLDVDADRHWKKLAFEIPDWIQSLAAMSRVGVENRMTLVNCWQESAAAHNLLAGLDYTLTFAEGGSMVTAAPAATKKTPQTLEELLAETRSIEIANDDLNIAVDKIVSEIKDEYPKLPFDFQIVINGTHLMEEGITKNQRLVDFKVENQPLGDILAQFVFRANTDKTSTGPSDPRTLLIWVIHEPEPGQRVVLITTRKAAAREGYQLPSQFVPPK